MAGSPRCRRPAVPFFRIIAGSAALLPHARTPPLFAELMLVFDLRNHREACALAGPVMFDRGIPDLVGYLRLVGRPVPAHVERAARLLRYSRTVFLAPFWPQIYERDTERDQSPEEAAETCASMERAYRDFGYETLPLPRDTLAGRAGFVTQRITRGDSGLPACQA